MAVCSSVSRFLIVAWLVGCCVLLCAERGGAQEFETLFDGESLKGWKGDENIWSVVDGCIVGRTNSETPLKKNSFLIYEGDDLQDFELKLKFHIEGERANSGIQFRSRDLGDYSVGGYQADIDITGRYIGILYEERGRGILAQRGQKVVRDADGKNEVVGKTLEEDEFKEQVKLDQWNEYTLIVKGNHIIQQINGLTTVDFTDDQQDKAAKSGILALQAHVGPPMTIKFKDVQLKRLDAEK